MAIEVTARVSAATGLELTPSFLVQHRTVGDLRHAVTTSSSELSSESTPLRSSSTSHSVSPVISAPTGEVSEKDLSTDESILSATADVGATQTLKPRQQDSPIDDSSPVPTVRITLLQGRPAANSRDNQTPSPFYMIADGTGTIATYIHLPAFIKSKMPVYGIDSPFLRCASRFTVDVGIPGAAKLIVEALVKKQPKEVPFWIGGFSGGAMIAYEVCRQLTAARLSVNGLLLIDMCSPRFTSIQDDGEIGLAMFNAISGQDESGVWKSTDNTQQHLRAVFASVATYNPTPPPREQPPAKRTAIIWAQKGMIDRCARNPRLEQLLADRNISTEPYPGFMEDPKMGAVAWSLPHKTNADLGPNGWDKFVGGDTLRCSSIDADHLQLPTPGYAHLLGDAMEQAFEHFRGS